MADQLADGCHRYEAEIGLKQNTEAAMRAAISAATTARMDFAAARTETRRKAAAGKQASRAAAATLASCRLRLAKLMGHRWNNGWVATGFPNQSTTVPRDQDRRLTLLSALAVYFTAHPAMASVDMDATAAACTAAHTALSDARQELGEARTVQEQKFRVRRAAEQHLTKRIRSLISELGLLIGPADGRWEAFGLKMPVNPGMPGKIASLTLQAVGGGRVHAMWSRAVRMKGTRLLTRRLTGPVIDADFVNTGTARGLELTLGGFVPGTRLAVKVIPYNAGGDGQSSPVVEVEVT